MLTEPLSADDAKRLIRAILADGTVRFSGHALEEMAADDITQVDAVNVLRGASSSRRNSSEAPGAIGFEPRDSASSSRFGRKPNSW